MGWLTDWLTLGSNQRLRNGQVLSSTHEAFSLPTTSPVHPDAFNPDMLNTPDPDSVTTPTYTYPPPRGQTYGYVPTSCVFFCLFFISGEPLTNALRFLVPVCARGPPHCFQFTTIRCMFRFLHLITLLYHALGTAFGPGLAVNIQNWPTLSTTASYHRTLPI